MTASHSRAMLVEGRECCKVFRTFKHKIVGRSVFPKCKKTVDNKSIVGYNTVWLASFYIHMHQGEAHADDTW